MSKKAFREFAVDFTGDMSMLCIGLLIGIALKDLATILF